MVSKIKQKKRELIREVATALFSEKGYENTTTRDISKAAKISNAALYYYFDSKEEILFQILNETMNTGLERIKEIEESDKDLKQKLSSILHMHAATAVDYNKVKIQVHDLQSVSPEHRDILDKNQRAYIKRLENLLDKMKEKGEMEDLDTKVCTFAFFGMVSWAYRWYNPRGRITPDQLSKTFHRIFTKGILKDR